MIEYLKELLEDLKQCEDEICPTLVCLHLKQKNFALESAIEILEKIKYEERSIQNGNIE